MIPKEIEFTEGSILWIEGGRRGGTYVTFNDFLFSLLFSENFTLACKNIEFLFI